MRKKALTLALCALLLLTGLPLRAHAAWFSDVSAQRLVLSSCYVSRRSGNCGGDGRK